MSKHYEVNTLDELESIIEGEGSVVVKFWATWCGPCKRFAPEFDKLAEQIDDATATVDIDASPEIVAEFGIMSVPTVLKITEDEVLQINPLTAQKMLSELSA